MSVKSRPKILSVRASRLPADNFSMGFPTFLRSRAIILLAIGLGTLSAGPKTPSAAGGPDLITYPIQVDRGVDFSPGFQLSDRLDGFTKPLSWAEIRDWAGANQVRALPDAPTGGFENSFCSFIKPDGAWLRLRVRNNREPLRLMLDFLRLRTGQERMSREALGYQKLFIYINHRLHKTVEYGYGRELEKPVELTIDPLYFPKKEITLLLRPAGGPRPLWALWDIHVARNTRVRGDWAP